MEKFSSQEFTSKLGNVFAIRQLQAGDEEALQFFHKKIAEETSHTLRCKERETPIVNLKENIENAFQSSTDILVGVFEKTSLIGNLQFRIQMPDHPWTKHVGEFGMAVLMDYWNQGIGKELQTIMNKFAKSVGVNRIEAKVRYNNERGITFYQRAGFKIEGTRKNGALINGKFEDEYFISKLLVPKQAESLSLSFKEVNYKDSNFSLEIRPIEEIDANVIHSAIMASLDILHPFMDWSHGNLSVENQIKRILKSKEDSAKGVSYDFSIFDSNTHEFLMSASLHPSRVPNKKCFGIGYWTMANHCNKGLATLVTKILIAIAFELLESDRVEISCNKANKPSQRVIEKCGFKFESEIKNYFSEPTFQMLKNGYHRERTAMHYALVKEETTKLAWFDEIKSKIINSACVF